MDKYVAAFKYVQDKVTHHNNSALFRLANQMHKKVGRGAITLLYTQVSDVWEATGHEPAAYLPVQIIAAEKDGAETRTICERYDPETQFVMAVTIGQENHPDKQVLRNVFVVDYIGKAREDWLKKTTVSLHELETRLENRKSWTCDYCGQRRKLANFIRDPLIGKLVYCKDAKNSTNTTNTTSKCFEEGWENGGQKLAKWYLTNRPAYKQPSASSTTSNSSNSSSTTNLPTLDVIQPS